MGGCDHDDHHDQDDDPDYHEDEHGDDHDADKHDGDVGDDSGGDGDDEQDENDVVADESEDGWKSPLSKLKLKLKIKEDEKDVADELDDGYHLKKSTVKVCNVDHTAAGLITSHLRLLLPKNNNQSQIIQPI